MATYVYKTTDGSLYSWSPDDGGQVADADTLAANGLAVVVGLPAIDNTHAWDAASHSVVTVAAPVEPRMVDTGTWILRFTPLEFQAISASTDATVQQFMYALNHTTQVDLNSAPLINGVAYIVSISLLTAARAAVVMA